MSQDVPKRTRHTPVWTVIPNSGAERREGRPGDDEGSGSRDRRRPARAEDIPASA
ncbi:hypothetical protein GCM10027451_17610 [Geodermatophilus aquaeductus]